MQTASNTNLKVKLLRTILSIVFIFTAVLFTKPIIACADSTNVTSLNGEAEHGYGSQVGKMHWAGSTSRTGFIFYFLNEENHLMTTTDLGLVDFSGGSPIVIEVSNEGYRDEMSKCNETEFRPKYSHYRSGREFYETGYAKRIWTETAPSAVKWDDNTGRWSGNGVEVANWLFSGTADGSQRWEKILRTGLLEYSSREDVIDSLVAELKGYDNLNIVIEPIAVNAVYGTETWGEEADTVELVRSDYDFLDHIHPDNYKPSVINIADGTSRVVRIKSTAAYMSQYVYSKTGCETGGANWKWTNEALPFCMTLQEDDVGKVAIPQTTRPGRISYTLINNESLSYGMGVLTKTFPQISTYDIDTNPTTPAKAEDPNPDKTGECEIIKVYGKKTIKSDGTTVTENIGVYKQPNTTNQIYIDKQTEFSATKYKMEKYFISSANFSGITYTRWNEFIYDAGCNTTGDKLVTLPTDKKYLYVKYVFIEEEPAPSLSYDFEIPESYITKQAYFSEGTGDKASSLLTHNFKWTSVAHATCPGHHVLSCGLSNT